MREKSHLDEFQRYVFAIHRVICYELQVHNFDPKFPLKGTDLMVKIAKTCQILMAQLAPENKNPALWHGIKDRFDDVSGMGLGPRTLEPDKLSADVGKATSYIEQLLKASYWFTHLEHIRRFRAYLKGMRSVLKWM